MHLGLSNREDITAIVVIADSCSKASFPPSESPKKWLSAQGLAWGTAARVSVWRDGAGTP